DDDNAFEQVNYSATDFVERATEAFERYADRDQSPTTQARKARYQDFVLKHAALATAAALAVPHAPKKTLSNQH
ncbi:hypothetical protein K2X33_12380, partial [bacterium]|nr:hypothetical protein [bacterium]